MAASLGVRVVPNIVSWAGRRYLEDANFDYGAFYAALPGADPFPEVLPPEAAQLQEAYQSAVKTAGSVVAVHLSSRLGAIFERAWQARSGLPLYAHRIEVFDSQSASLGLGFIVEQAALMARKGYSLPQIVRSLRRLVQQTHVAFYVDSLEFLRRSGFLESHFKLAESLQEGRQILRVDEGILVPFERVRSRSKALDGLQAFVLEFPKIERLGLLYAGSRQDLEELLMRLDPFFPRETIVISRLNAAMGLILGPSAIGVAVFEGEPQPPVASDEVSGEVP
jgi:DegV family protein with EDD domain